MATQANLIATYNANPTLQNQYTLDQYLALFDFGTQTPTPTPTTTPTPTPEVPGIPNIINQNINQGGGGDGGPQGIATPSTTYERTYAPDLNFAEFTSGVTGTPSFTQEYTERKNPIEGLMELYQKYSPIGMIGKAIQGRKDFTQAQTNKALEQVAMQQKIREAEAAAAAAEQARLNAAYQQQTITQQQAGGGGGGQFDGASSKAEYDSDPTGFSGSFQDGGRVYLYNRLK